MGKGRGTLVIEVGEGMGDLLFSRLVEERREVGGSGRGENKGLVAGVTGSLMCLVKIVRH